MLNGSQKLAVLLCKFEDTAENEPQTKGFFEDLFIHRKTGGLNDYWSAVSYGKINLDGTEVYGWRTLNQNKSDFIATHVNRKDKIRGAKEAFSDLDFTKYAGVVVVVNSDVGDGGSQGGVLVNFGSYNLTFIAHELGHLFGLEHSFDKSDRKTNTWSAPGEYWDQHDIMSAMNVFSGTGTQFAPFGPILCAPNMDRMGWLDAGQIWTLPPSEAGDFTFDLVSLSHPEIPGYHAARVNQSLYVEFRTKDGWDAAIPRDTVLIHKLQGVNAIVVSTDPPIAYEHEWLPGSVCGITELGLDFFKGVLQIRIESFDLLAKKARITVRQMLSGRSSSSGSVSTGSGTIGAAGSPPPGSPRPNPWPWPHWPGDMLPHWPGEPIHEVPDQTQTDE